MKKFLLVLFTFAAISCAHAPDYPLPDKPEFSTDGSKYSRSVKSCSDRVGSATLQIKFKKRQTSLQDILDFSCGQKCQEKLMEDGVTEVSAQHILWAPDPNAMSLELTGLWDVSISLPDEDPIFEFILSVVPDCFVKEPVTQSSRRLFW